MRTHLLRARKDRPLILGHRGVPLLHQENTLASFRKAVELGIDGVELDVFLTRDNQVIVFHDRCPERLTGHKGDVTQMSWEEISKLSICRQVDVGRRRMWQYPREHRIPLLEEVLGEFRGKLLINIELKADIPVESQRRLGAEVARLIRGLDAGDSVFITSVGFYALQGFHMKCPESPSGFSYETEMLLGIPQWLREVPEIKADGCAVSGSPEGQAVVESLLREEAVHRAVGSTVVDIDRTLYDSDRIVRFHEANIAVGVFTLFDLTAAKEPRRADKEDLNLIDRLVKDKVDWIETDDPVQLQQFVA